MRPRSGGGHVDASPKRNARGASGVARLLLPLTTAVVIAAGVVVYRTVDTDQLPLLSHDDVVSLVDPDADDDGDGLLNSAETSGFTTVAGEVYATSINSPDTDQDGLTDGEEAGVLTGQENGKSVYVGVSDPLTPDSDDDGVVDADEYFMGTDPWSPDTDEDGLDDLEELGFGSDPYRPNPDEDDYADPEERERGSAPLAYDESGWRAALDTGLKVLKYAIDAADRLTGGAKVAAVLNAVKIARTAGVATPIIWDALKRWEWSDVDMGAIVEDVFGDDMAELGETLEGGSNSYAVYVAYDTDGALKYVGLTPDFDRLSAQHGGARRLSLLTDDDLPLGQARAVAQAVVSGAADHGVGDLINARGFVSSSSSLFGPSITWGNDQLSVLEFGW